MTTQNFFVLNLWKDLNVIKEGRLPSTWVGRRSQPFPAFNAAKDVKLVLLTRWIKSPSWTHSCLAHTQPGETQGAGGGQTSAGV